MEIKKTKQEGSSLTGRSPSVHKFAVRVGAEERHSDFGHHLQTHKGDFLDFLTIPLGWNLIKPDENLFSSRIGPLPPFRPIRRIKHKLGSKRTNVAPSCDKDKF